jgi:methionine biosynthesis protein MetW
MRQIMAFRKDLLLINSWIKPNSKVLDLGCGDGELLKLLKIDKNINGYGIDYDVKNIKKSLQNNINVLHMDLDDGLDVFESNSFDYIVLAQSLQVIKNPKLLIDDMLRVGDEIIVSFPNMGHWLARLQLFLQGTMPITKNLPYRWHDTPNIHLCTIKDFMDFCKKNNYEISEKYIADDKQKINLLTRLMPNLFGEIATFRIK